MDDSGPIADLNSRRRDLLYLAAARDGAMGQTLKAELEDLYDESMPNGTFYPAVDGLVERGYLTKGEPNGRRNAYGITHKGRDALKKDFEWRSACYDESELLE